MSKSAFERALERLLEPRAEYVRNKSVVGLLGPHERRSIAGLEDVQVHRLESKGLSTPRHAPGGFDVLERGGDPAGPRLPAKLGALRYGALHRDRLDSRVPARPLTDSGEHFPDELPNSSDLSLARCNDRSRPVDPVVGRLNLVLDDARFHPLLLMLGDVSTVSAPSGPHKAGNRRLRRAGFWCFRRPQLRRNSNTARTRFDSLPVDGSRSFVKMVETYFSTARSVITRASAMP